MDEGSYKARGGELRGHGGIRMGAAATVGRMIMNACGAVRDFGFIAGIRRYSKSGHRAGFEKYRFIGTSYYLIISIIGLYNT